MRGPGTSGPGVSEVSWRSKEERGLDSLSALGWAGRAACTLQCARGDPCLCPGKTPDRPACRWVHLLGAPLVSAPRRLGGQRLEPSASAFAQVSRLCRLWAGPLRPVPPGRPPGSAPAGAWASS